jgi:hypothetical protein
MWVKTASTEVCLFKLQKTLQGFVTLAGFKIQTSKSQNFKHQTFYRTSNVKVFLLMTIV